MCLFFCRLLMSSVLPTIMHFITLNRYILIILKLKKKRKLVYIHSHDYHTCYYAHTLR